MKHSILLLLLAAAFRLEGNSPAPEVEPEPSETFPPSAPLEADEPLDPCESSEPPEPFVSSDEP